MEIAFELDGRVAGFSRNGTTGRTRIVVGSETIALASPWNPFTHLELGTRKTWRRQIGDHDVVVEKVRPRTFGGLRENSYRILVDGNEVAAASGT